MTSKIAPEVADLLGESLLFDPSTGTRLLTLDELHSLMTATGGYVELRRLLWKIEVHGAGDYVRISMKRERHENIRG